MYMALIALFLTLAVLALIGWGVAYVVGRFTKAPEPVAQGPMLLTRRTESAVGSPPEKKSAKTAVNGVKKQVNGTAQPKVVIETYFEKGRWKNKVRGNSRASNVHDTREAAVAAAEEMAAKRKARHVVVEQGKSTTT